VEQLITKRRKEADDRAKAERTIAHQSGGQAGEEECGSNGGQKSPSPETEEEEGE